MAASTQTNAEEVVSAYLRQPYARIVIPEADGTYRGEILEFPGCIATGETSEAALAELEEVARDWLHSALHQGIEIPNPLENHEYSGRLVLRLPKSLHKKAARLAEWDGVSLNQFILTSLASYIGQVSTSQSFISLTSTANVTVGHVDPIYVGYQNLITLGSEVTHGHSGGQVSLFPLTAEAFAPLVTVGSRGR
jgi:antitoxin HicB